MTVNRFLHQDRIWVDSDGNRWDLHDMDPDHRANLIPFLRGNCRTLYMVEHQVDLDLVDPQVAEEWLADTPLMRRLVELEQGRAIDERRVTHERNVAYENATGYQKVRLG